MNTAEAKRVLETALICAVAPLPLPEMRALFDGEVGNDSLRRLLDELSKDWQDRGVELVALASGWRFQSRPELRPFLDRLHPEKPPKYSRAALETLAIVAYRQPVTRGDIEDIRGVTVSGQIVKQLEDRGWIDAIGYREAPGRPALYATSRQFLDDLGLASLDQLPPIDGSVDAARSAQALAALEQPLLADEPEQGSLALDVQPDMPTLSAGTAGTAGTTGTAETAGTAGTAATAGTVATDESAESGESAEASAEFPVNPVAAPTSAEEEETAPLLPTAPTDTPA